MGETADQAGVIDLADRVFVGLVGLVLLFVRHALGGVRASVSIVTGGVWGAETRDSRSCGE